ncbi:MAG: XisI protein [Crocosphaera sp.]
MLLYQKAIAVFVMELIHETQINTNFYLSYYPRGDSNMDTLNQSNLKQAIIKVLEDYRNFLGSDPESEIKLVIDETRDHYLLIETVWHHNKSIYGTLIHIDIIYDKIWIQQDGTQKGIAHELINLDISPQQIVLGFKTMARVIIINYFNRINVRPFFSSNCKSYF